MFIIACGAALFPVNSIFMVNSPANVDTFEYTRPESYDVVISYFKVVDLFGRVSTALECPHLQPATIKLKRLPIYGAILGMQLRQFICLPVKVATCRKPINVAFLVDSGAFHVFLSNTTLIALGFTEIMPNSTIGTVNGVIREMFLSSPTGHFSDLNILGGGYFDSLKLSVLSDYPNKRVIIQESKFEVDASDEVDDELL